MSMLIERRFGLRRSSKLHVPFASQFQGSNF